MTDIQTLDIEDLANEITHESPHRDVCRFRRSPDGNTLPDPDFRVECDTCGNVTSRSDIVCISVTTPQHECAWCNAPGVRIVRLHDVPEDQP